MNDALMRSPFHRQILRHAHDCSETLVLDELGLNHGSHRADIAVINGTLSGYEIKSDHDSLVRLPTQIKAYDAIFDYASIVVGPRYALSVRSIVPSHWGIFVCYPRTDADPEFEIQRHATTHTGVNPISLAQLLWKTEVVQILVGLGMPSSRLRKRRSALYHELAEALNLSNLRQCVARVLKNRKNWRRH
jgi:hypothetical protein